MENCDYIYTHLQKYGILIRYANKNTKKSDKKDFFWYCDSPKLILFLPFLCKTSHPAQNKHWQILKNWYK